MTSGHQVAQIHGGSLGHLEYRPVRDPTQTPRDVTGMGPLAYPT